MRLFLKIVTIVGLIVGVGGRFWGAWVNNESNDDHVMVVQRILAHQSITHKDSCWECFQPPAYYQAHASFSKLTGAQSRRALIQQMQLTNAVLSLIIIWLIYLTFRMLFGLGMITRVAWLFCLLNPALFSMSIQGTNDFPVILFATIAGYLLIKYLHHPRTKTLVLMGVAAFLSSIFKGSGIVVFLMFTTWLIGLALWKKQYTTLLIPLLSLIYLVQFSQYRYNYDLYGNAFETNLDQPVPPDFFDNDKPYKARPGITSVWNSYGHFRILDMLQTPYNVNVNEGPNFPAHRTSFWSQMYGSFFDVQFLQHPYMWESKHPDRLNLVRLIFVLALFPIFVLAFGMYLGSKTVFQPHLWRNHLVLISSLTLVLGMFAFNLKYTYDYRDFGCIKAIFMLPVFIPMLILYAHGWRKISEGLFKNILRYATLLLLLLTSADLIFLVVRLTRIEYGFLKIV